MRKLDLTFPGSLDVLRGMLLVAPQAATPTVPAGFATDDVHKLIPLLKKATSSPDGIILLEEAEYVVVKNLVGRQRWNTIASPVPEFLAAVENATTVEVEAKA